MATTVNDVANAALQELGVLAGGEVASAEDAALGLEKLNDLIDQWQAERLMIYTVTRTTWTIVSGTASYTVGSGGDVNITWPRYIEHAGYVETSGSSNVEYLLDPPLTTQNYAGIRIKTLQATLPTKVYYDRAFSSGLGNLTYWPVPTSSTLLGVIYHPAPVTEFSALTSAVSLPPGYRRMLKKNLAVELAPSFNRQPSPLLLRAAMSSKAVVKRGNFEPQELGFEFGVGENSYNIDTDE